MSQLFLIHGFGIGLTSKPFCTAYGTNCGFEAFEPDIQSGKAYAFRWAINRTMKFNETCNPITQFKFYLQELHLTRNPQTHLKLHDQLQRHQPSTILCHSLGSVLFLNYASNYDIPSSVKKIIFVQADISHHTNQFSPQLKQLIHQNKIQLHNYYCPYDQALLASAILSHYIPAGLIGLHYPPIHNHFFPLFGRMNLHASSICNPKFRATVFNLTS